MFRIFQDIKLCKSNILKEIRTLLRPIEIRYTFSILSMCIILTITIDARVYV